MLTYTYNFKYNEDGEKTEVFIFSALSNPCATADFSNAQEQGVINDATISALTANTYAAGEMPKAAYWLPL